MPLPDTLPVTLDSGSGHLHTPVYVKVISKQCVFLIFIFLTLYPWMYKVNFLASVSMLYAPLMFYHVFICCTQYWPIL